MKERNYGIDSLKSVSMLMVVVLHVLGVGGILLAISVRNTSNNSAWILETANICAVNCFGLVSGYVLSRGHYRRSRLLSLWIRVVFESLLVTAAFAVFLPGSVKIHDWILAFTPVVHEEFWYFTAYFALFFFVPYINKMISVLSKKELITLALSVVFVFTILGNVTHKDVLHMQGGYSFLWITCLYVIGACLRNIEIEDKINKYWYLAAYFLCVVSSWCIMEIFQFQEAVNYESPLVLLAAVLLLMFFRRLEFKSTASHKIISMLARTSFGVYIIHTNPLIWNNLLAGHFVHYTKLPIPLTFVAVILTAIAIYAVCTLADWLVEKFFKLVRIDLLEAAFDRLSDKILKTGENNKIRL
jgi:surface polysaccharide O-acyltransferase-like enzyme